MARRLKVVRIVTRLNVGGPTRHVSMLAVDLPDRGIDGVLVAGMAEPEMARIADLIGRVLRAPSDDAVIDEVRGEVRTLCEKFPVY